MLKLSKGTLWAGIISGSLAQLRTHHAYTNGALSGNEYTLHTTQNVTGALGLIAGLEYGAMLGSRLLPGAGTVVGTVLGGILGDRLGSAIGLQVGQAVSDGASQFKRLSARQPVHQLQ